MTAATEFWRRVRITDECWLWTGYINDSGYGMFHFQGRYHRAHRWIWEQMFAPIPMGLEPDHTCRVRPCVRFDHLEIVTHRVNLLRGTSPAAVHAMTTHCPQGHEYTPENTGTNNRGERFCRTCSRIKRAEYVARKKAR